MSAWTAVIPNSFGMFLIVMQWIMPLRPMANRFGGCFCLGSGPVLWVLFCFCCLLRCFRWRNASLAGGFAGRRFLFGCGFRFCCFNRFADSKDLFVLVQCIFSLLSCKDRAISATSATLEEKKKALAFLFLSWSTAMSFANLLLWLWHTGLLSLQKLRS